MDTLEKNRLIAEFMGAKYGKDVRFNMGEGELWLPFHGVCNYKNDNGKSLRYTSSWDWLMRVVDKIYKLEIENELVLIIRDALADASLQGTYDAVVEFIIWNNKNN